MLELRGKTYVGLGMASSNLITQLQLVAKRFPEISGVFTATINIELQDRLLVVHPSHRTEPILWEESSIQGEVFDFLRIEFLSADDTWEPSWLYIAHDSPHRRDLTHHEIILRRRLDNFDPDDLCIRLHQPHRIIPFMAGRIVVV